MSEGLIVPFSNTPRGTGDLILSLARLWIFIFLVETWSNVDISLRVSRSQGYMFPEQAQVICSDGELSIISALNDSYIVDSVTIN